MSGPEIKALRLKPPEPTRCGNYDLDAFVIEYDAGGPLDFRCELGSGLMIYWALPAARDDRLRLLLVDCAAAFVDEPSLIDDPFTCDLRMAWRGALASLADGTTIEEVDLEISASSYRCRIDLRPPTGANRAVVFRWALTP